MSDLCPVCSKELEAAVTFGAKQFKVCFDCNYLSVPESLCRLCEGTCLKPRDHNS